MYRFLTIAFLFLFSLNTAVAQDYRVGLVGFYNFENLFDTLDTPDKFDQEFTPSGEKQYGTKIYREKLNHLARVVSEIGADVSPDGLAILGVAEIENRAVLEDFAKEPAIAARNYQVIHYESPDRRGIDVAMLYNPKYFKPSTSKAIPVYIYKDDDSTRIFTRDILYVSGDFDGDLIHIFVNHWPSRSGGEAASAYRRNAAALVVKQMSDSLNLVDPSAKIIVMGDLNDDPISPSVAKVLDAKMKGKQVRDGDFYNPMYSYFKRGIGTLAYRDSWNLFDQVIISAPFLDKKQEGYRFYKAGIHNPKYLYQQTGRYRGYPFRTFSGDNYIGGYSDHFPVYVVLVKPVE